MTEPPRLPTPSHERWPLVVALLALLAGAGLLGLALAGGQGRARAANPPAAPAIVVATPTPAPAAAAPAPIMRAPAPTATERTGDERRFTANERAHVPAAWVSGFYDIYAQAQRTFGVNWLLIASVHKQETAFSTHPTTYHGLNFARCCAGPMQFNVTNRTAGTGSTWARYRDAGAPAQRPAAYPHATTRHPSVYDDYDAIMAAAALLRDSGAGPQLDASAWRAAYDYYGHDLTGVSYADEVLARAIGWGQRRFCINCGTDPGLLGAVDAAWGAPLRAEVTAAAAAAQRRKERDARRTSDPTALAARAKG
ncbi:lytic transglycosylase domain-containing protein [Baekduia soli]|uniref:Lytic transglycosylase domain-containing protein n=1 Tax=Baekduia soli TaxID=496014 RepID=A0A5B8U2E2_9ACTN|nr:lytic transglycosylase domain-containing protein [Baekduia soli]QEC47082.1 lytic transglycosylase domain-containing protein [Baekduia soli]